MKKLVLLIAAAATATTLQAQGLSIGGRYASYATKVDAGFASLDSGRESSVGFLAAYRNAGLVIDGMADHDFESGTSIGIIPLEIGKYSRDRVEGAVGYSILPNLDLSAGVRYDSITLGGDIFGIHIFDDLDLTHQALLGGATLHSKTIRPFGWYVLGRGYIGSAKFDVQGVRVKSDTTGGRLEAGLPIPLGLSGWELTPGVEVERLKTNDYGLKMDTNRFFLALSYSTGH